MLDYLDKPNVISRGRQEHRVRERWEDAMLLALKIDERQRMRDVSRSWKSQGNILL